MGTPAPNLMHNKLKTCCNFSTDILPGLPDNSLEQSKFSHINNRKTCDSITHSSFFSVLLLLST